jgi:hypothetical protein
MATWLMSTSSGAGDLAGLVGLVMLVVPPCSPILLETPLLTGRIPRESLR